MYHRIYMASSPFHPSIPSRIRILSADASSIYPLARLGVCEEPKTSKCFRRTAYRSRANHTSCKFNSPPLRARSDSADPQPPLRARQRGSDPRRRGARARHVGSNNVRMHIFYAHTQGSVLGSHQNISRQLSYRSSHDTNKICQSAGMGGVGAVAGRASSDAQRDSSERRQNLSTAPQQVAAAAAAAAARRVAHKSPL
ncbi:Protein of unknown function [Gryllus bimaculatus]|nr:Protein of unknown function [Gryllus bimaculatus]